MQSPRDLCGQFRSESLGTVGSEVLLVGLGLETYLVVE